MVIVLLGWSKHESQESHVRGTRNMYRNLVVKPLRKLVLGRPQGKVILKWM